jgi:hypothetical protein
MVFGSSEWGRVQVVWQACNRVVLCVSTWELAFTHMQKVCAGCVLCLCCCVRCAVGVHVRGGDAGQGCICDNLYVSAWVMRQHTHTHTPSVLRCARSPHLSVCAVPRPACMRAPARLLAGTASSLCCPGVWASGHAHTCWLSGLCRKTPRVAVGVARTGCGVLLWLRALKVAGVCGWVGLCVYGRLGGWVGETEHVACCFRCQCGGASMPWQWECRQLPVSLSVLDRCLQPPACVEVGECVCLAASRVSMRPG